MTYKKESIVKNDSWKNKKDTWEELTWKSGLCP